MFDFPNSPTNGQKFTPAGGPTYVFAAPVWKFDSPTTVPEAPVDGQTYGRNTGVWVDATEEAPSDSNTYGRMNGTWVDIGAGGGGGSTGEWSYNAQIIEPPSGGQIRGNNADQTLVTLLWINDVTSPGSDVSNMLAFNLKQGAQVYLQDKDTSSQWNLYDIIAPVVDKTTYFEVPVQWNKGGTALPGGQRAVMTILAPSGAGVIIKDTPPSNPVTGTLWWESDTGSLYIYYDDGDSKQWVMVVPGAPVTPRIVNDIDMQGYTIKNGKADLDPYILSAAGMQIKSVAVNNIAINNKADGTGVNAFQFFSTTGGVQLGLDKGSTAAGYANLIRGYANGKQRWDIILGEGTVEGGSNAGSDFAVQRWSDAGVFLDIPLKITRSSGAAVFTGTVTSKGFYTAQDGNLVCYQASGTVGQPSGGTFMVQQNANANTFLTFHQSGVFACNFGMNNNGTFYMGGWSFGNGVVYQQWSSRDFANPACDYRIKENIEPLPSMWEKVKALKPVSYTIKEFSLPEEMRRQRYRDGYRAHFNEEPPDTDNELPRPPDVAADPTPRWGLIAHEVQEALIETAANGVKDDPDIIQSPTALPIITALTKALQEAMARIEALEAKLNGV